MIAVEELPSVSSVELAERRRQLRRQRRWRVLQTGWRFAMMGGLTAGLVWALTLPDWMIRGANQVIIEGNRTLSADAIRSLLPIQYPQFVLTLKPQEIAHSLESQAPIANVSVTRHLFPPSLTVHIQERYPVAVLYTSPIGTAKSPEQVPMALLDEKGVIISYENYVALNQSKQLPQLKVSGYQETYRSQWVTLYSQISRSPIKITELDWRDPGNLVLYTELGKVYCGAYSDRFGQQLQVLDRMRQLSKNVDPEQISYIDLHNPDTPILEMTETASDQQSSEGSEESEEDTDTQPPSSAPPSTLDPRRD